MTSDLTKALHALTAAALAQTERQKPPAAAKERGAAPRVVSAVAPTGGTSTTGGGPRSPVTEVSRTYYPERTVTSADGFYSFRVKAVKSITYADADGSTSVFYFADEL